MEIFLLKAARDIYPPKCFYKVRDQYVVEVENKIAESEYTSSLFSKRIMELGVEINASLKKQVDEQEINDEGNVNMINAKGIKKKLGVKPTKGRLKSCLEKKQKKKKW
ncbi:hypothetical protein ACFE04_030078 [Oxalis oulophora]